MERIVGSLAADESDWVRATLATLESHSPTMPEVTHHALTRGRQMPLADCFRMELGIVYRAIDDGNFIEGVRALIIDKDERPRFAPNTLAQVRAERVQLSHRRGARRCTRSQTCTHNLLTDSQANM